MGARRLPAGARLRHLGRRPGSGGGPAGGKADTGNVTEGSPEARAILTLCDEADFDTLRNGVGLSSTASNNIVDHEDKPFDDLAELDAVPYVGPASFNKLLQYVVDNGLVQGGGQATVHGVVEGSPEALAMLELAGSSDYDQLRYEIGVYAPACQRIVDYEDKPFDSLAELDAVPYVGASSFAALLAYVLDNGLVGGGGGGGYVGFDQRLQSLVDKYPDRITLARRRSVPVVFVKTADLDVSTPEAEAELKEFYKDIFTTTGTNSLMAWNLSYGEYMHVGLGYGDNDVLEDRFKGHAWTLAVRIKKWDMSMGNMDVGCLDPADYDAQAKTYLSEIPCFKSQDTTTQRLVAVVKLSQAQLAEWNAYMAAIIDDFDGTLGPYIPQDGMPPYLGDPDGGHNCTSYLTSFLHEKVSSSHIIWYNPSDFLRGTWGYWDDPEPERLRAFLVFNHPHPPAAGTSLGWDFELPFGY